MGKVKKFNSEQDAIKFGTALEKLGYSIKLYIVSASLYTTITTLIYETSKKLKSSI